MKYKTRGLISVVELEDIIWRPTVPSCDNSSCRRHPSLSETSVNLGLGMAVLDDLIVQKDHCLSIYNNYSFCFDKTIQGKVVVKWQK